MSKIESATAALVAAIREDVTQAALKRLTADWTLGEAVDAGVSVRVEGADGNGLVPVPDNDGRDGVYPSSRVRPERVHAYISKHPHQRGETIAKALGITTKALRAAIKADKRIKGKGKARGTTYSVRGGGK